MLQLKKILFPVDFSNSCLGRGSLRRGPQLQGDKVPPKRNPEPWHCVQLLLG
jgi:hypothetical protein